MRKVIWCCLAAVVVAAGSYLSLAYYACCCPDSVVGRTLQVVAEASVAMQPMTGLTSMAMRANQATEIADETAAPVHESVPDDPQPIPFMAVPKPNGAIEQSSPVSEKEFEEVAPIVIHEEDPVPATPPTVVLNERTIDIDAMQKQEVPPKGCPTVMPRCQDEVDEPAVPKKMPPAEGAAETDQNVFKAWMNLFTEGKEEKKTPAAEELPPPVEEQPQAEPKCQEDSHLHEQYPGCPRTSSPFISKDRMDRYFKRVWDLNSKLKKKGGEENSEETHSC